MKSATKRAHITQRQASKAVKDYIRTKPYSAIGIRRVPCLRCGQPSAHQWNICSLPGFHGICTECDIGLNEVALRFMAVPDADHRIAAYRESKSITPVDGEEKA